MIIISSTLFISKAICKIPTWAAGKYVHVAIQSVYDDEDDDDDDGGSE